MLVMKMHSNPFDYHPSVSQSHDSFGFERLNHQVVQAGNFHCRSMPRSSRGRITPHVNDVLMGRGGKNNQHSGNERLRKLARRHTEKYKTASKKGKSALSRELVQEVRDLDPPARYVGHNTDSVTSSSFSHTVPFDVQVS